MPIMVVNYLKDFDGSNGLSDPLATMILYDMRITHWTEDEPELT
jgi:hypothetical protein